MVHPMMFSILGSGLPRNKDRSLPRNAVEIDSERSQATHRAAPLNAYSSGNRIRLQRMQTSLGWWLLRSMRFVLSSVLGTEKPPLRQVWPGGIVCFLSHSLAAAFCSAVILLDMTNPLNPSYLAQPDPDYQPLRAGSGRSCWRSRSMSCGALPITKVIVLERISGCFPACGGCQRSSPPVGQAGQQAQDGVFQRIFKEKQHMPLFGSRMPLESLGGIFWHIMTKKLLKRATTPRKWLQSPPSAAAVSSLALFRQMASSGSIFSKQLNKPNNELLHRSHHHRL